MQEVCYSIVDKNIPDLDKYITSLKGQYIIYDSNTTLQNILDLLPPNFTRIGLVFVNYYIRYIPFFLDVIESDLSNVKNKKITDKNYFSNKLTDRNYLSNKLIDLFKNMKKTNITFYS